MVGPLLVCGRTASETAWTESSFDVGLGTGVHDRLIELGHRAVGINVAEAASDPERYANQRAECSWQLRHLFEAGGIAIPDDEGMQDELTQLKYQIVSSNAEMRIAEQDERRQHLSHSPDRADSLVLASATREGSPTPVG